MTNPAEAAATRLTDAAEVLFRQVHPSQIVEGQPNKEAFNPSARDDKKLSALRERVGPSEAYRRWTEDVGSDSAGTYGVSVGEIDSTTFCNPETGAVASLHAVDDACTTRVADHASVVFSDLSKGQRVQAARKLRDYAVTRGCLHP